MTFVTADLPKQRWPLLVLVTTKVADTECRQLACQTGVFKERRLFENYVVQCSLDSAAKDESGKFGIERSGFMQSGSEEGSELPPSGASKLADCLMLVKVRNGTQKNAV